MWRRFAPPVLLLSVWSLVLPRCLAGDGPFTFRGVTPGTTTAAELIQREPLGAPIRQEERAAGPIKRLEFTLKGYRAGAGNVVAHVGDGVVRALDVFLPKDVSAAQAARVFRLGRPLPGHALPQSAEVGSPAQGLIPRRYSGGAVVLFVNKSRALAQGGPTVAFMRLYAPQPVPRASAKRPPTESRWVRYCD